MLRFNVWSINWFTIQKTLHYNRRLWILGQPGIREKGQIVLYDGRIDLTYNGYPIYTW